MFANFQHTAYRLELRDRYSSSDNQKPLREWVETGTTDMAWIDPWLAKVRAAADEGRFYRRVRVVSLPPTDYTRYSTWAARLNVEAGEDIRYLDRDQVPAGLPEFDYWLFDSRTAARMHFDDEDVLLGFDLVTDPAELVELSYWRDAAWHHAITRDDFASQLLDQR
ncbi:DUF6879 family protein [Promicromonospora sukumoe]|uniref:DUF6879 family protein n=1 Tax=Promicromonospora sukumoe TaxID=88382 RepID=UPI0031D0C7BA